MERVGIRELRQNLSIYVERVKAGEALEVTERGRPVAMLRPLGNARTVYDRLIEQGLITPAASSFEEVRAR
jgi:prevent-host-death family protein